MANLEKVFAAPSKLPDELRLNLDPSLGVDQFQRGVQPGQFQGATITDPGQVLGAQGRADFTNDLFGGLGITGPADVSDQIRQATLGELNIGEQRAAAAQAGQLERTGLGGSGTEAALATLGNIQGASNRAGLERDIGIDAANRQAAFDAQRLGIAQGFGQESGQFALNRAGILNQANLTDAAQREAGELGRAQFGLGQSQAEFGADLARAGLTNDENFRRQMAEREANVLFPIELQAAKNAQDTQRRGQIISGVTGALSGVAQGVGAAVACWVAEEVFGVDNPLTHDARYYALSVDTPFTRAYKEHGQEWAEIVKNDPASREVAREVWTQMAKAGRTLREMELN